MLTLIVSYIFIRQLLAITAAQERASQAEKKERRNRTEGRWLDFLALAIGGKSTPGLTGREVEKKPTASRHDRSKKTENKKRGNCQNFI